MMMMIVMMILRTMKQKFKKENLSYMKHLSSPTPFLHPAGSPFLPYYFSLLKIKVMNIMESKIMELLLGQEAVRN